MDDETTPVVLPSLGQGSGRNIRRVENQERDLIKLVNIFRMSVLLPKDAPQWSGYLLEWLFTCHMLFLATFERHC
jgi:hypothetical protein